MMGSGGFYKSPVFILGEGDRYQFMSERIRLDKYLLEAGLMNSRSEAQAAIDAGKVRVNGAVASKANQKVSAEDDVQAEKAHPYVSRAALKLKGALDVFPIDVMGLTCLDVGCSTGGFSEVLIEAGARHVFAVDVGRDQFHERLRKHSAITLYEQTDARKLSTTEIYEPIDLIVCDASFIGLEKVLVPSIDFLTPTGQMVLLFKPQFQVGPKAVGKGGIVTNEEAIAVARANFTDWLNKNGLVARAWAPSPIIGSDGNQEWLVWVSKSPDTLV